MNTELLPFVLAAYNQVSHAARTKQSRIKRLIGHGISLCHPTHANLLKILRFLRIFWLIHVTVASLSMKQRLFFTVVFAAPLNPSTANFVCP